jgi:hypothetical protein
MKDKQKTNCINHLNNYIHRRKRQGIDATLSTFYSTIKSQSSINYQTLSTHIVVKKKKHVKYTHVYFPPTYLYSKTSDDLNIDLLSCESAHKSTCVFFFTYILVCLRLPISKWVKPTLRKTILIKIVLVILR